MKIYNRDPLDILIDIESRTCKGCMHEIILFDRRHCTKGKKHGRRCKTYFNQDDERRGDEREKVAHEK